MRRELEGYKDSLYSIFEKIYADEEQICVAAQWIADEFAQDKVVHAIGTGGHSNLVVEEMLWRAGGLAPMNAMLDCGTNLMMGAKRSNIVERTCGYGQRVFDMYACNPGDLIIICNSYGINPMTIDVALEARKRGLRSIAITSTEFCTKVPKGHIARHPSGYNLYEIVDAYVDTHVPYGDSIGVIDGFDQKVAGSMVLCASLVWNLIVVEVCCILVSRGMDPPVWTSGNVVGGDAKNEALEKRFFSRIKHLQ